MAIEFTDKIRRLPVYPTAGGYALDGFAMLASNEAPFGPMPGVVEAAAGAVATANRYPDPSNMRLRRALAARYDYDPMKIAIGAGSCDILLSAAEALLEPGAEVVYAWPSFSVYPHMAAATGATAIRVPLDAEHRHDLDAMLAEITAATRLVIVCNPNNPTGTAHPLAAVERFMAEVPRHVCVILDEAYCEFSTLDDPDASLALLKRHANLVLLRTFSKVYGLAGLRVGYALCGDERFRVAVEQVRQPFFCNSVAQAAAEAALLRQDELTRRIEETVANRLALEEGLRELGLDVAESQSNFIWHSLGDGDEQEILAGLRDRKVLIRSGRALGREGWARTTVGTSAENRRFLDALRELV
ncbi:histidinol-phosphate transaminase [Conexibacter stalactiti]|uniref:Histidinol-phosphate aminotransferase n=1 Tax=Conexibacter stalactiti TaxID=1940611 RepID=A0ABU4HZR9_9ACTN|nr:histidinol-phosphate transaminase [Conexibacter stalactiti]MDW5598833.1 histidinol-phosphate transaminase [Conexibacter stalactiti]MEC5039475.1 histidinol-phosphate transaminase [Conexibacter stalactiti]